MTKTTAWNAACFALVVAAGFLFFFSLFGAWSQ